MVVKREEEGEERRGEGKKFIEYIIALLKACFGLRDVSIDNLLLSPPPTPFPPPQWCHRRYSPPPPPSSPLSPPFSVIQYGALMQTLRHSFDRHFSLPPTPTLFVLRWENFPHFLAITCFSFLLFFQREGRDSPMANDSKERRVRGGNLKTVTANYSSHLHSPVWFKLLFFFSFFFFSIIISLSLIVPHYCVQPIPISVTASEIHA